MKKKQVELSPCCGEEWIHTKLIVDNDRTGRICTKCKAYWYLKEQAWSKIEYADLNDTMRYNIDEIHKLHPHVIKQHTINKGLLEQMKEASDYDKLDMDTLMKHIKDLTTKPHTTIDTGEPSITDLGDGMYRINFGSGFMDVGEKGLRQYKEAMDEHNKKD